MMTVNEVSKLTGLAFVPCSTMTKSVYCIRRNIPKRAIGCMTIQLWSACSKYCCSVSLNSLSKRFSPFFKVRTLIGIGH